MSVSSKLLHSSPPTFDVFMLSIGCCQATLHVIAGHNPILYKVAILHSTSEWFSYRIVPKNISKKIARGLCIVNIEQKNINKNVSKFALKSSFTLNHERALPGLCYLWLPLNNDIVTGQSSTFSCFFYCSPYRGCFTLCQRLF